MNRSLTWLLISVAFVLRGSAQEPSEPYRRMNFGPALFWTFEVAPGNIAQKGLAVRLDPGPGGVSKGKAWMVYDLDTVSVATATTGDFVDWRGIGFDGSHGTHTRLTGEPHVVNPTLPGWVSPTGSWEDVRVVGRDGRRFGPLPRDWARHRGVYFSGDRVVVLSSVQGVAVWESPGWIQSGPSSYFTRDINLEPTSKTLLMRVGPDSLNVSMQGKGTLRKQDGFWVAELSGASKVRLWFSKSRDADWPTMHRMAGEPSDLSRFTHGGPERWSGEVQTSSVAGREEGPFVADTFPLPVENPWASWMRPGGFDFTPDGQGAMVATWNGDVWRVDGLRATAPGTLRWRRVASGLFQPLGVKYRNGELFITCRDQLARLHDLNGDGEMDFIEAFNSDHQVTEHFHEFAMGLQTDAQGNFYYAKSARHALPALVPHHGTLLRVSADGQRTDIVAHGFRAANGVCLNEDGSFFVTDQEGHWTPKNRINRVRPGGFYGNMFGYTDLKDSSDDAMEQPMVWITNAKDRSPAELLWVPRNAWGTLGGALLSLSYGTGRIFVAPHEQVAGQWQGAVCELPLPAFPTGIMRGRFADDGALYACGLFSWAGNATAPGGFYRIRRRDSAAWMPLRTHAAKGRLAIEFSEPLPEGAVRPEAFAFKTWSLKRSAQYGSRHYNEKSLEIRAARVDREGRTLTLEIPELAPTQCYELKMDLESAGQRWSRSLHGTLHRIAD